MTVQRLLPENSAAIGDSAGSSLSVEAVETQPLGQENQMLVGQSINNVKNDEEISCDDYQVVRAEFFTQAVDPVLTLSGRTIRFNSACMRKMPETDYVQLLVNPIQRKLVVRPCNEEEEDAIAWISMKKKRTPKQITCKVFSAMMMDMMGWDAGCRYKLLGKIISSDRGKVMVFDLDSYRIDKQKRQDNGQVRAPGATIFPAEWEYKFGLPTQEHQKLLQINTFDDYTVFSVRKRECEDDDATSLSEPEGGDGGCLEMTPVSATTSAQ